MFTFFQKRMKLIFIVLLILIAPGFFLYGIWSYATKTSKVKVVGEIWGHEVTDRDYRQHLLAVHTFLFLRFPAQYENLAKFTNFEQLAWQRILLSYTAEKMGVTATDEEVRDYIRSIPAFQGPGQTFDVHRYDEIVRNRLGVSLSHFENIMEQNSTNEKLIKLIESSAIVFETDIQEYFREMNEEVNLKFISFLSSDYIDDVAFSDEDLRAYLERNRDEFTVPDRIRVSYIMVTYDELQDEIQIPEEEMKDYYESNKDLYKALPDEVRREEQSEALKEEEAYRSFEEVKEDIKSHISRTKAEKLAVEKCRNLFYELGSRSLVDFGKEKNIPVKETKFFSRDEVLPEIGISPESAMTQDFYSEIFQIEKSEVTSPIKTTKGVMLAQKIDVRESHKPESLEEVYPDVRNAYIRKKSLETAREKARAVQEELEGQKADFDFESKLKELGLSFQETGYFKRIDSYVAGIGISRQFMSQAFSLSPGTLSPVVEIPGGAVVFKVIDKKKPDFEKLEEQKPSLREKLQAYKSSRVLQDWIGYVEKVSGFKKYPFELKDEDQQ